MLTLLLRYFSFCILLFALAGCNKDSEQTLRLAHISWPGYEAISLAKSRGLYKKLNITTYRLLNNEQVMLSFEKNIVDVAALTLPHTIELQSNNTEPLLIIAVLDISHGSDAIIANKNIKSIKDLKDKRVGMEPTAFGAFFISRALSSVPKLSFNNLQLVPINVEDHFNMFTNNNIDAIVTYEPSKSKILKHKGHVIFDSKKTPNEIVDVLVTRLSFAKNHSQALVKLLNGYFKALDILNKVPKSAIQEMAEFEGINYEEFRQSLKGIHIPNREENIKLLKGNNSQIATTAKKLHHFMKNKKIITTTNNTLPGLSNRFLLMKEAK